MRVIQELEALLFVAGEEGIEKEELEALLHCTKENLTSFVEQWSKENQKRALQIIDKGSYYVLGTKPEYASLVEDYANFDLNSKLTKPCLETLAIIAYEQPITKIAIDEIRGVNSSQRAIQKLLSYQLIEEIGRLEQIGRPKLYGTTDYFLSYFELNSLEDLPPLTQEEKEKEVFFDIKDSEENEEEI